MPSVETAATLPRRRPAVAGILHLGLGNFHRAHQAVYTAKAMDAHPGPWGIVGVANRSRRVVDAMNAQDGRYGVLTLGADGARCEVLDVHLKTLVLAEEGEQVVDLVAHRDIRVVTLTITEKGYAPGTAPGETGETGDARGRSDVSPAIAVLAQGLLTRFRRGGEPISLVSCDNLTGNGRVLRRVVRDAVRAFGDDAVLTWLDESVGFPCTMVDRIVPATEPRHTSLVHELTGLTDAVPVPAEPFTMWVMEDDFPGGRPAWEDAGATFVADVAPYELLKLRLVNATNSLLAYLGILMGEELIARTVTRPGVSALADRMMREEMLPTFEAPPGVDVDEYIRQLFARFSNVPVGHRTLQVGADGSVKLPIRIVEPVLHHHDRGVVPSALALLAASYVRVFTAPSDTGLVAHPVPDDPGAEHLRRLGTTISGSHELVRAVLTSDPFPPSLERARPWLDLVGDLHAILATDGVEAATRRTLR